MWVFCDDILFACSMMLSIKTFVVFYHREDKRNVVMTDVSCCTPHPHTTKKTTLCLNLRLNIFKRENQFRIVTCIRSIYNIIMSVK